MKKYLLFLMLAVIVCVCFCAYASFDIQETAYADATDAAYLPEDWCTIMATEGNGYFSSSVDGYSIYEEYLITSIIFSYTAPDGYVNSWVDGESKYIDDEGKIAVYHKSAAVGATSSEIYAAKKQIAFVSSSTIYAPVDSSNLFNGSSAITTITFNNFNTSNVTNMSYMFGMESTFYPDFQSLDLSTFDTSKVTDMSYMFNGCKYLETLTFGSGFNTSNVTNMSCMFSTCKVLTTLDLSNFNTSNVTDMSYMFEYCEKVNALNVSNFDTSNVTNMSGLFYGCETITSLNVKNFNTSNVTNMSGLFSECISLESIDVSNFDTSSATDISGMFSALQSITELDISALDTSNVISMEYLFGGCSKLTTLDLSTLNTKKVTKMQWMFAECTLLEEIIFGDNFSTTNVDNRELLPGTSKDPDEYNGLVGLFNECNALKSIDLSKFDTTNTKNMSYLFCGCSSLTELDLSKFDTSKVTEMSNMFDGCSSLKTLDLSKFDTSNVEKLEEMFQDCSSLESIALPDKFVTDTAIRIYSMFNGCSKLKEIDLSTFDTSNVTSMTNLFDGCASLTKLDLSYLDTSKISSVNGMFAGCSSLETLDISVLALDKVTYTKNMFNGCAKLKSIDLSTFSKAKIYNVDGMFNGCESLYELDLRYLNLSSISTSEPITMFDGAHIKYLIAPCGLKSSVTIELDYEFDSISLIPQYKKYYCSFDGKTNHTTITSDTCSTSIGSFVEFRKMYNVEFFDYDGDRLANKDIPYGIDATSTPLGISVTPTRQADDNYAYIFDHWTPTSTIVTYNVNFTAIYKTVDIELNSSWKTQYLNKTSINPNTITSIVFSKTIPDNYTDDWDGSTLYIDDNNNIKLCHSNDSKKEIAFVSTPLIYASEDSSYLFSELTALKSVDFTNFSTSKATNMSYMFYKTSALNEYTFDTRFVTNMSYMFAETSLTSIDISAFNTGSVVNFEGMFNLNKTITTITLGNKFNSSNATNLSYMFNECYKLETLDINHILTNSCTDLQYMFYKCKVLQNIDLTKFNTAKVENFENMFAYCELIQTLDISSFNFSSATNMSEMFYSCVALEDIDFPDDIDTVKVTNMNLLFGFCQKLSSVDFLKKFDTSSLEQMGGMFYYCSSLVNIDISNFKTSNLLECSLLCLMCENLETLVLPSDFNTSNCESMSMMFSGCSKLKSIDVSMFNTSKVTNMLGMFAGCSSLTSLDVSSFNTSKVTIMTLMFSYCSSLTSLDVSSFDTSKVTTMQSMFNGCSGLTELNISNFDMSSDNTIEDSDTVLLGLTSCKTIYAPKNLCICLTLPGSFYCYNDQTFGNTIIESSKESTDDETYIFYLEYSITFVDDDGTLLLDTKAAYNTTPVYTLSTPFKAANEAYSYEFKAWDPVIYPANQDQEYRVVYNSIPVQYKISFIDGDGQKIWTQNVNYGEVPVYTGETPTKTPTTALEYIFKEWSPELEAVTGTKTYTAVFISSTRKYNITWVADGETIYTDKVEYLSAPDYISLHQVNPTKSSNGKIQYAFKSWSPAIVTVENDATYTAIFEEHIVSLPSNSSWENVISDKLNVETNEISSFSFTSEIPEGYTNIVEGEELYADSDKYISIYYDKNDPTKIALVCNSQIVAPADCSELFKNYSNLSILDLSNLDMSNTTNANGIFDGTSPDIIYAPANVPENINLPTTYKNDLKDNNTSMNGGNCSKVVDGVYVVAKYVRSKQVKWFIDSNVYDTKYYAYDESEYLTYANPTKESTEKYVYTFSKWVVKTDSYSVIEYVAEFIESLRKYTITFVNYDGTTLSTSDVEYGSLPEYTGATPTNNSSENVKYIFKGWNKEIKAVTGAEIYTAIFEEDKTSQEETTSQENTAFELKWWHILLIVVGIILLVIIITAIVHKNKKSKDGNDDGNSSDDNQNNEPTNPNTDALDIDSHKDENANDDPNGSDTKEDDGIESQVAVLKESIGNDIIDEHTTNSLQKDDESKLKDIEEFYENEIQSKDSTSTAENLNTEETSLEQTQIKHREPRLGKIPEIIDGIIATNSSKSMVLYIATLLLATYNNFKNVPEDRETIMMCISKLVMLLKDDNKIE